MEQIKELEEVLELLNTKQYTKLRQYLAELNDADIAGLLEELEEEEMLKVFRILPKDLAADVFSYLDMDNQQKIITSLSDKEATNIINNLMADDAADLLLRQITRIAQTEHLPVAVGQVLQCLVQRQMQAGSLLHSLVTDQITYASAAGQLPLERVHRHVRLLAGRYFLDRQSGGLCQF